MSQWIFLCHSSSDKPAVRKLCNQLRSDRFDPWLDEERILPGQNWEEVIADAVQASSVVIVCLSASSINKVGFLQKEIKFVLDRADEQPEGSIFVIPARLEYCEVPKRLRRWQWVDLFDDSGFARLKQSLATKISKTAAPPPLPPPPRTPTGIRKLGTHQAHSQAINAVAVSGNGGRLVAGSNDNTLSIWDRPIDNESLIKKTLALEGHASYVYGVAVSNDGKCAVSACGDSRLKVWNLDSGKEIHTLEGHKTSVHGVALNQNGDRAVSGSTDGTMKLWNLERGIEVASFEGWGRRIWGVALNADATLAISASEDHALYVWDVVNGDVRRTLKGHLGDALGVAFSGNEKYLVSASEDRTLKVWETNMWSEHSTLRGHSAPVRGVSVSKDGRFAVSASDDRMLKIWNIENSRSLATFEAATSLLCCAWFPDGRTIVAGDADGALHIFEAV